MKYKIFSKKNKRYAIVVVGFLSVFLMVAFSTFSLDIFKASASTTPFPSIGMDIGDYGSGCTHNYDPGYTSGSANNGPVGGLSSNSFWTPTSGGTVDSVNSSYTDYDSGEIGVRYHGEGSGYASGDCVQIGYQNGGASYYTSDFRIGISVGTAMDCSDLGAFSYTPWASAGGGSSATISPTSGNANCFQLEIQTKALPNGVTQLNAANTYIASTITNSGSGDTGTSYAYSPCSLNQPFGTGGNCTMGWQGHSNFQKISVLLGSLSSMGAVLSSSNIPTTFTTNQTVTNGSDSNPLNIVVQNTGNTSWNTAGNTRTPIGSSGTGTCQIDSSSTGFYDSPDPDNSAVGAACTVSYTYSPSSAYNFSLHHISGPSTPVPSIIPMVATYTPETISITKTHKQMTVTECIPSEGAFLDNGILKKALNFLFPVANAMMIHIPGCTPESTTYDYILDTYSPTLPTTSIVTNGNTWSFPLTSFTAASTTGSQTDTWQMYAGSVPFGNPITITTTVNAPAVMSGTLTPAPTSCWITSGSSCNVSMTWTTTNPVGTSSITSNYPVSNTTLATGNSGTNVSIAIPYASSPRILYLYNNGVLLAQSTATSSCSSGEVWNGTSCSSSPAPTGTLTPSPTSCSIASGASSCNVSMTWTTTNPVGTSSITSNYPVSNTTLATGNSGTNVSIAIPYASSPRILYLYNNALLLAQSTATATCTSGTNWNGTSCAPPAPINGVLGTACGRTYSYGSSSYAPYIQCSAGTSSNTTFPPAGGSTTWQCNGLNGGTNSSTTCTAYQTASGGSGPLQVSLTANPTTIVSGGSSTLTWSSIATACTGTNFSTGNKPSGTLSVSPTATTTYTVNCTKILTQSGSASATVKVLKKPVYIEK